MIYKRCIVQGVDRATKVNDVGLSGNVDDEFGAAYACGAESFSKEVWAKEDFEKRKENFLQGYCYRFFKPAVYENEHGFDFVSKSLGKGFVFNFDYVMRVVHKRPEFDAVEFNFDCVWNETRKVSLSKEYEVTSCNVDEFKKKFDCFVNQFIFDKQYLDMSTQDPIIAQYSIIDGQLHERTSFKLRFKLNFEYLIMHLQGLKICYRKRAEVNNVCKKTFKLKLPSKDLVDLWQANERYYAGDFVEYKNKYYKANHDSIKANFCLDDWKNVELNEFSFSNIQSFKDTVHGQKAYELLKQNLQFLIEQKIGNSIAIYLEGRVNIYNINDYFLYQDVQYRIIEIQEMNCKGRLSLIVKGLEVLPFDYDKLNAVLDSEFSETEKLIDYCADSYNDRFSLNLEVPKTVVMKQSKEVDLNV